jgi:cation diffusion facilitator family transporter
MLAGVASLAVGVLLLGAKFTAWRLTGSSAILSDALESIINVVASLFALASLTIAARPPDEDHPYGHGKIEYFSAGFEGALIILAAGGIFVAGVERLSVPRPLPRLDAALLLLVGAALVNLALGLGLVRIGRRTASLTLVADGKHILTDVATSAGVVAGLLLARQTGYWWFDGATACAVGVQILYTGGGLVRVAFSGLMNTRDPQLLEQVSRLLAANRQPNWIDIHQLRAWRAGTLVHIDLHLILPRDLSLDAAHGEGKELERMLADAFGGQASVLIHLDPCTSPTCPVCGRYGCDLRSHRGGEQPTWDWQRLTQPGPDLSSRAQPPLDRGTR